MCFDIDVNKLTLEELRDTLRRITMLLSKPTVVNNLPDKGHQLRQTRAKLENEIKFRESLEETRKQMHKLSIRCASEANIPSSHSSKLCSIEKKPERERFKLHLSLKSTKTKSMKELHSGTKLINLTTSLSLLKEQDERVKTEQVKAKQERVMSFMNTDNSDSEETPEYNSSDYSAEEANSVDLQSSTDEDEPGPSYRKVKKEVKMSDSKLKKEMVEEEKEPEEKMQSTSGEVGIVLNKTELKEEPGDPEKMNLDDPKSED